MLRLYRFERGDFFISRSITHAVIRHLSLWNSSLGEFTVKISLQTYAPLIQACSLRLYMGSIGRIEHW